MQKSSFLSKKAASDKDSTGEKNERPIFNISGLQSAKNLS